jgi:predicted nucleic acid-binding protein
MRFWDSSALVALVVDDAWSASAKRWHAEDPDIVAWCLSPTEVWSAVARRRREDLLRSPELRVARQRLAELGGSWHEIDDVPAVRSRAQRLLEVHPLRAADALQLAAALLMVQDRPDRAALVTVDVRLGECADSEGFTVVGAELR